MTRILQRPLAVAGITGLAILAMGTSAVIGATIATNGGPVTNVRTMTATETANGSGTTPTDVAGSTLSVAVPAGQNAIFVITFSAESHCVAGLALKRCFIRVLLDGSPTRPGDVIFDATGAAPLTASRPAKSMQFVAGPAGPGTHSIKVQMSSDAGTSFELHSRTLTVLRSQA